MRKKIFAYFFFTTIVLMVVFFIAGGVWLHSFKEDLHLNDSVKQYENQELVEATQYSRRFMNLAMRLQKEHNFAPSVAARLYAYTASIYSDVLTKTKDTRQASAATSLLLIHMLPQDRKEILDHYYSLYKSNPTVVGVAESIEREYEERSNSDNSLLEWDASRIPAGSNYWFVRDNKVDGGAMSGEWKPWILSSSTLPQVPQPPVRGSLRDRLELAKVQYAVNYRKPADQSIISFWHGSTGFTKGANKDNISPAGLWQNILFAEEGAGLSDEEYAKSQKILAQSIADSFIYTWKVKYTYYTQRPSMRIPGLAVAVGDPPFPSYISGHSTISKTAAVVLSNFFPDKEKIWNENAKDARYSRLLAGIHFDVDNDVGEWYGGELGKAIVGKLAPTSTIKAGVYALPGAVHSFFELSLLRIINRVNFSRTSQSIKPAQKSSVGLVPKKLSDAQKKIQFTDVAVQVGLVHDRSFGAGQKCSIDGVIYGEDEYCTTAGGVTVGDYDNDGWPDLYVTRLGEPGVLYKNIEGKSFRDVTQKVGLRSSELYTNGALFADINNDGWIDLYVTTFGAKRYLLYMNNRGYFTEEGVARDAVLNNGSIHMGQSAATGDYDGDGWLDLYVGEWRFFDEPTSAISSNSVLLKNIGASSPGHFVDVTSTSGVSLKNISKFGVFSYSATFADMDSDGRSDLLIAGDLGTSRLFWNNGDGTFTDGTIKAGVGTDENGMGSAIADYNGDGFMDWFVSAIFNDEPPCLGPPPGCVFGSTGNRLYVNNGNRIFADATDKAHVRDGGWGWGTAWIDSDNKGTLDLVLVNGMNTQGMNHQMKKYLNDPMRFWYHGEDEAMVEAATEAGLGDTSIGTGLATLDYNRDGRMDIVIVENGGTPRLYRNDTRTDNAWLKVRVLTKDSGRDAVGAVVKVVAREGEKPQVRQVGVNSSFLGQSELTLNFGLGLLSDTVASVTVEWPWLKKTEIYTKVPRNSTLIAIPE